MLFQQGLFQLSSGLYSFWKIDCDSLDIDDWSTLAQLLTERLPEFGSVQWVPSGGAPLAEAMSSYITKGPVLICDDVWTTGGSMKRHRASLGEQGRDAIGAVVFARTPLASWDSWVTPLFTLSSPILEHG